MKRLNEQLWITKEDAHYVIGVTKQLQCDAGDITYVQIAPLGEIAVDETLVNVEASKAAIEVPSTVKGIIIERNEKAEVDPSLLDSENPNHHWLVKVEGISFEEYKSLEEL